MVLQREVPIPIWGLADPDEEVIVSLDKHRVSTKADTDGRWYVHLPAMGAGGPHTVTIHGTNTITLNDVYIGEVWVCSGQSNMQWPVINSANAEEEVLSANWPMIRMYTARQTVSPTPRNDVEGKWSVCSPDTIGGFSAVGYFFGRDLHKALKVPIGLLNSSWGGTRIEPWIPAEALKQHPSFTGQIERVNALLAEYRKNKERMDAEYQQALKAYQQKRREWETQLLHGGNGLEQNWASPETDYADWQNMSVLGGWEGSGDESLQGFDGVIWFIKRVRIPESWEGHALTLHLGAIDDTDKTYFNGELVGEIGFETPGWWFYPREYTVPAELVRPGEAVIAVRIVDTGGPGGLTGFRNQMFLKPADLKDADAISLAGEWHYRVDISLTELPPRPAEPQDPAQIGARRTSPAAIYNGMISPLVPYGIRGAIWYQGESNAGSIEDARAYRELLPMLIRSWRQVWGLPDMPFGIVQLANFLDPVPEPVQESAWAELRDAQLHTFKTVPNTGLAVITDIGEAHDIHPKNKQDVGGRLARWALATVYGRDAEWSGPIYREMTIEGNRLVLSFDHIDGGLKTRDGGPPQGFAIAGADGQFVHAKAEIHNDQIVVWSDEIPNPVMVRYAWTNNPDRANLVNALELPASPFRTDPPTITYPDVIQHE
ncbi:MAG: sialate O-acetylesterase [Phycisphaeraceae bacterium]